MAQPEGPREYSPGILETAHMYANVMLDIAVEDGSVRLSTPVAITVMTGDIQGVGEETFFSIYANQGAGFTHVQTHSLLEGMPIEEYLKALAEHASPCTIFLQNHTFNKMKEQNVNINVFADLGQHHQLVSGLEGRVLVQKETERLTPIPRIFDTT
jgi:hypothetical protein